MALTAKQLTNWFLYNQATAPSPAELVDDKWIRSPVEGSDSPYDVTEDMATYMTTGAGRFAVGQQFDLIDQFYGANISTFTSNPAFQYGVEYSAAEIAGFLGITVAQTQGVDYNEVSIAQINYNNGGATADYAELNDAMRERNK